MTTRANPSLSFDSACRHLFRHLHEPRELRRNPLVNWYFAPQPSDRDDEASAKAIRETVRACADTWLNSSTGGNKSDIVRRQYAIIIQGDLERVSSDTLCARLGISHRQFCRDQSVIRHRIATIFGQKARWAMARYTSVSEQIWLAAVTQASLLDGFGMSGEALGLLQDVLAKSIDESHKIEALLRQAEIYIGLNDFDRVAEAIDSAQRLTSEIRDPTVARRLSCDIELVRADVSDSYGQPAQASNHAGNALYLLEEGPHGLERRFPELRVRALSFAALYHSKLGKLERAVSMARQAAALTENAAGVPPRRQLSALELLGRILSAMPSETAATYRAYRDALDIARQNGLTFDIIAAERYIAGLHLRSGRVEDARMIYEQCISAAKGFRRTDVLAIAQQGMADLGMLTGTPNAEQLLECAESVLALVPAGCAVWIRAKVAQAHALLQLGNTAGAMDAVNTADQRILQDGELRYRTMTLRQQALIYERLADLENARAAMQSALRHGLQYSDGLPQQLAVTYEAAAKILDDATYAQEAKQIWNELRYPA